MKFFNASDFELDLYHMPPPDSEALERRQRQVDDMKRTMGDKYLLATPVQRITKREVHHGSQ